MSFILDSVRPNQNLRVSFEPSIIFFNLTKKEAKFVINTKPSSIDGEVSLTLREVFYSELITFDQQSVVFNVTDYDDGDAPQVDSLTIDNV
jgi:hypothetical protein